MMIMIGGQALIINFGGAALAVEPLDGPQWGFSILFGIISLPMGVIIRLIPDSMIRRLVPSWLHRKKAPQVVVTDEEQRFEWPQPIEGIREELAFLKRIRGGRLNAIKFRFHHPRDAHHHHHHSRSRSGSRSSSMLQTPTSDGNNNHHGGAAADFTSAPPMHDTRPRKRARSRSNSAFGPAAAMAGVVAGSIAGWSPIDRNHGEGGNGSRGLSAADVGREELEAQEGIQVHPGTSPADAVVMDPPRRSVPGDAPPSQTAGMTPAFHTAGRTADQQQP